MCTGQLCQEQGFESLAEVIEHLRGAHRVLFIKHFCRLDDRDNHGHLWYCFKYDATRNKGHRSFDSAKIL